MNNFVSANFDKSPSPLSLVKGDHDAMHRSVRKAGPDNLLFVSWWILQGWIAEEGSGKGLTNLGDSSSLGFKLQSLFQIKFRRKNRRGTHK
jgi:hypothetical protein